MSVEIDVADLPDLAYYKDEICQTVEEIFQNDTPFSEFAVKRKRYADDPKFDPIIVQDEKGKELVWLDEWEIDVLSESELLSYIRVQIERNKLSDDVEGIAALLLIASLVLFGIISMIFLPIAIYSTLSPFGVYMILSPFCLVLMSGSIFLWRRRIRLSKMQVLDIEILRSDSTYIEAIRKLAGVSKTEHVYNEEHEKRLADLESALGRGDF